MCGGFTDNKIFPSLKNQIKIKPKLFFSVMEMQAKLRDCSFCFTPGKYKLYAHHTVWQLVSGLVWLKFKE